MSRAAFVLAALLALPLPAAAQVPLEPTGADLAQVCESDTAATRDACGGLLVGLLEVYVTIGSRDDSRRIACPPRMMTADEMRSIFVAWANTRADLAAMSVTEAAAGAVRDRFPCTQMIMPRRRQ